MKKATTKKTAPKIAATPTKAPTASAPVTGKALKNFRVEGTFHAIGEEVTLTGDQIARYQHFLEA